MVCIICGVDRCSRGSMCRQCGASYDGRSQGDASVLEAMKWAAKRARRFERARRRQWLNQDGGAKEVAYDNLE